MARRLRRTRYRRRRGYTRRSTRRRRIYGKRKAASQQRQRANFVVKATYAGGITINPSYQVTLPGSTTIDPNPRYTNVGGTAVLSVYRNLIKSNYFQAIKTMYDQVRVNSCKVTITPTTSVLVQGAKQGIFVSAWDRNGVDDPKFPPSFPEITSHSSAFQKPINLDASSWKATRKIYAASIAEKSFFIPTGMLSTINGDEVEDTGFLASLGQNVSVQWNPQLLIGVIVSSNSAFTIEAKQQWGYIAQFEWSLTFRGLRYDVQNSNGNIPIVQAVINPVAAPSVGQAILPEGSTVEQSDIGALGNQPMAISPIDTPRSVISFFFQNFFVNNSTDNQPDNRWQQVDNPFTFSALSKGVYALLLWGETDLNEVNPPTQVYRTLGVQVFSASEAKNVQVRLQGTTVSRISYRLIYRSPSAYDTGVGMSVGVGTNPVVNAYQKSQIFEVPPQDADYNQNITFGTVIQQKGTGNPA